MKGLTKSTVVTWVIEGEDFQSARKWLVEISLFWVMIDDLSTKKQGNHV